MPLTRIAIVGRPNVGKSSLMNLLARGKVSIVDPTPGVTRDRVSAIVTLEGPDPTDPPLEVEVTDTGGFGVYVAEGGRFDDAGQDLARLTDDIEFQIKQAIAGADLVLFVVDAQAGITAHDENIARMLRERILGSRSSNRSIPIRVVANKTDGPKWEAHALEAAALGFGEPLTVSAKNNYFRRDFCDALWGVVRDLPRAEEGAPEAQSDLNLAIIGKRNAGKSSLVNALAGEDRVIVSEIAGTTRDAIDVRIEMGGRTITAIDTAGLRKKKSFADQIEWYAFDRVERSIDRADVVILLVDATERLSQVDEQLAMLIQGACRPAIIVVNKWDLVVGRPGRDGQPVTTESYETYIRGELKGLDFAPISFISAKAGTNIHQTMDLAFELLEQSRRRIGTGELNRLFRKILETRGPSSKLGTFAKVLYAAQVAVQPPTIVLVVNRPELFTPNYERFLLNRLREVCEFPEVPIKLIIRGRKRDGDPDVDGDSAQSSGTGGGGAPATQRDTATGPLVEELTEEEAARLFEDEE